MRQFVALTALTALETLRQPLVLLLTTTTVVLTAAVPMVLLHQFGDNSRVARDGGLAFQFVFGLLIAAYAAGTSLSDEIHNGTAAAVMSKPVGRIAFLLAKYAGVTVCVFGFSVSALLATLLSQRIAEQWAVTPTFVGNLIDWQTGTLLLLAPAAAYALAGLVNYLTRRPFGSTAFLLQLLGLALVLVVAGAFDRAGQRADFDFQVQWRMVPAGALIAMALAIFAAVAMALATRLPLAPTMTLCLIVFAVGLMLTYLTGLADGPGAALLTAAIPNWQHFWAADLLAGDGIISTRYLVRAALYALTYIVAVLALGAWSFETADI